ncbi:MAG: 4-hydroxy-tetrahydrodipicolinate synthase family protein [Planctomycetota bacterium]|jgi:4-hydroxy-tetrahydrodipicolinate synthase
MFTGAMVALITPFQDGEIDFETLDELIDFQLEGGIDGIVPVGTTGESCTLSHDEQKKVMARVVDVVSGQTPVIVGAGSNSTAEAIELTAFAKKTGADATLQVTPYYNKPTQEGFYEHFRMTPETIASLAEIENVVAVKEATGSLDQASEIASRCDITIVSGDDSLTLPLASIGAKGVISVVANIVPADVKAMTDLILEGDLVSARQWHRKLFTLCKSMLTLATNPIPIKRC